MATTPDFGPSHFTVALLGTTVVAGPPTVPGGWNDQNGPPPPLPPLLPQRTFDQLWPNPLVRPQRRELRTWTQGFTAATFSILRVSEVVRETLHSADGQLWVSGVTREALHSADGQLWVTSVVRQVLRAGPVLLPLRTFDQNWPNPIRRTVRRQDFVASIPYTSLYPPPLGPPISQTDWPNPRGARRLKPDWQFGLNPNLPPTPPPEPPIGQYDWPLPRGRSRLRPSMEVGPNLCLGVPLAPPLAQHDWPNPRGRRYARQPDYQQRFYGISELIRPVLFVVT